MVGLPGLHMSDDFRCSNVLASMGLKSFCPWCLKIGGNTETIVIHLRKFHYRMAIVCNICQSFTSMNAQVILEHCSECKAKCNKECTEQEGWEKAKNGTKRFQSPKDEMKHPSHPAQRSLRSPKE